MFTIDQSVQLITVLLFVGLMLSLLIGWSQISSARKLPYFLLRRERTLKGWRWIAIGFTFGLSGGLVFIFGTRVAYIIIPPTPSQTPTATITLTPTISATPSITYTSTISPTPTITPTASVTPTPKLPEAIAVLIRETVTPDSEAVFSPIMVAERIDSLNRPVDPAEEFENPIRILYGAFTYDNFTDGIRWTAIWYYGDEVVCIEKQTWDGGTGGYGYTECLPELWLPGNYEIQMFIGEKFGVSTRFTITGEPPTPTPTPSRTPLPSPTS
jgi:hypothetical protein